MEENLAIVLAMFGTTVESGLRGLLAIRAAMVEAFPQTPVVMAFTANQIRHVWRQRAADPDFVAAHPSIPAEILGIQGPLAAIANLQDQGYRNLVVQSVHMVPAEEFHDLASYVRGLLAIRTMKPRWRPFNTIALGRPALGGYDLARPYGEDVRIAAEALSADADLASRENAALVYMGHGNPYFPASGLYLEFAAAMRRLYPGVLTLISTVEGYPPLEETLAELRRLGVRRVVLKPLLLVAGEHALRDLAGPGEGSWSSILERQGMEVVPVLSGLGEEPAFARILVQHAADAAADSGLELR